MEAEFITELRMSYDDLCIYLQKKYGLAKADYFTSEECKSKSKKISRTSEGLFCHHIYENVFSNLGEVHIAKISPYECQKKENLVYCNYLEHLILHLKINVNACSVFDKPIDVNHFFNSLGFFWIANDLNALYKNGGSTQKWRNDCYNVVRDNFEEYVAILMGAVCYIDNHYSGEKHRKMTPGETFVLEILDPNGGKNENSIRGHQYKYIPLEKRITEVNYEKNYVAAVGDSGAEKRYQLDKIKELFDLSVIMEKYINEMCKLTDGILWQDLKDKIMAPYSENARLVAELLEQGISSQQ